MDIPCKFGSIVDLRRSNTCYSSNSTSYYGTLASRGVVGSWFESLPSEFPMLSWTRQSGLVRTEICSKTKSVTNRVDSKTRQLTELTDVMAAEHTVQYGQLFNGPAERLFVTDWIPRGSLGKNDPACRMVSIDFLLCQWSVSFVPLCQMSCNVTLSQHVCCDLSLSH